MPILAIYFFSSPLLKYVKLHTSNCVKRILQLQSDVRKCQNQIASPALIQCLFCIGIIFNSMIIYFSLLLGTKWTALMMDGRMQQREAAAHGVWMSHNSTKRGFRHSDNALQNGCSPGTTWTAGVPSGKVIGHGHSSQLLPLNLLLGLYQRREDGFTAVLESWLYFCCSFPMQSKASIFNQLLLSLL